MAWLLRSGEVLASLDLEANGQGRLSPPDVGAKFRRSVLAVHALGAKDGMDVAFLDDALVVRRTCSLGPFGVRLATRGARHALEAERGAFERWALRPGDQLEIQD